MHTPIEMETISDGKGIAETLGRMFACFLFLGLAAGFLFTLILALTRKSKGWIAGAVATGVLSLVTAIVAIGYGVRAASESAEESGQSRDFATRDGLATLTGRAGWRELELGADAASLSVGSERTGEFLLVISELKTDFEPDLGVREFAELASEHMLESVAGAEPGELREVVIQGRPAYEQELSGSIEGVGLFYLNTYVEGKEHFHQLMSWTLVGRKERLLEELRAAAATFREIDPEDL